MQQLKKVVLTQRSLFSSKSLVERFPKILNDVLASSRLARKLSASKCDPNSNVEAQKSERTSGRDLHLNISADARKRNRTNEKAITSKSSEEVAATGSKSNSCRITIDNIFVVRIVPSLLHLLRRVQRFEQVRIDDATGARSSSVMCCALLWCALVCCAVLFCYVLHLILRSRDSIVKCASLFHLIAPTTRITINSTF